MEKVKTAESPSRVVWREIEVVRNVTRPVNREEPRGVERVPVTHSMGS